MSIMNILGLFNRVAQISSNAYPNRLQIAGALPGCRCNVSRSSQTSACALLTGRGNEIWTAFQTRAP
eukprot:4521689-Heterocapsa_arctica.AAC.1